MRQRPDPGLSAQRTRLAWRRTAMSAAVVALLAVRPTVGAPTDPAGLVAGSAALIGWAALTAVAYRRARGLNRSPPLPGRRTVPAAALITCVFALIGLLLLLA